MNLKKNEAFCSIVQTMDIDDEEPGAMEDAVVIDIAVRQCKLIYKGYDEYIVQRFGYDENGFHLDVRMTKKVKIK